MKKAFTFSALTCLFLLSGCSWDNPFGVGYEHSACESSAGFGICGSPENVYRYKDKIKEVQKDYLKSGYEDDLFFGITDSGDILVKEGRTDKWLMYEGSSYEKKIKSAVKERDDSVKSSKKLEGTINYTSSDVPVTEGNDLSLRYEKQGQIIQTRTQVGDMIRDNGIIQKVWIAPVIDQKGDLVSAHEIFVVVKDPQWLVGESTPKAVKASAKDIPTPMSKDLLEPLYKPNAGEDKMINLYNSDRQDKVQEEIQKEKKSVDDDQNINQIQQFIQE